MEPQPQEPLADGSLLAAIDLGSNSFHLIVARVEHGEMRPVEALAEKVQLGAGLADNRLSPDAIERGLDCLARFAQMLGSVDAERIRVVGTNALRVADNRRDFTRPAQQILGAPVDVVYGREEARLVYLGVAHTLADDAQSRLVVDIGGGSTELIIGQRFEPQHLESLQMGCVSYSDTCFPGATGSVPYPLPLSLRPLGRVRGLLRHPAGDRSCTGQPGLERWRHQPQGSGETGETPAALQALRQYHPGGTQQPAPQRHSRRRGDCQCPV